jgi:hypothetical protein
VLDPVTVLDPIIENYSASFGYSGDEITIYGTNFTNDISKIDLKFEDRTTHPLIIITAQVLECSDNHIVVKLPSGFN